MTLCLPDLPLSPLYQANCYTIRGSVQISFLWENFSDEQDWIKCSISATKLALNPSELQFSVSLLITPLDILKVGRHPVLMMAVSPICSKYTDEE